MASIKQKLKERAEEELEIWNNFFKRISKVPMDWGGIENEEFVNQAESFLEQKFNNNYQSAEEIVGEIEQGLLQNSIASKESAAAMIFVLYTEIISEKAINHKTQSYRAAENGDINTAKDNIRNLEKSVMWEEALLELSNRYSLPQLEEEHNPVRTARLLADVDAYLAGNIEEETRIFGEVVTKRDKKKLRDKDKKVKRRAARRYENSVGRKKESATQLLETKCEQAINKREERLEHSLSAMRNHLQELQQEI